MQTLMRVSAILTLILGTLALTACPAREGDPTERTEQALRQVNLHDDVNLDWDHDARTLHLRGTVPSDADRQRAEEVANQAVGTAGRVVNELVVEHREEEMERRDDQIQEDLDRMFEDRTGWDFDPTGLSFDVNAGVVTVEGTLDSAAERQMVIQRVQQVPGVRDVVDKIEVRGEPRQQRNYN